jgi:AraC-like DNA-binding protein
VRRAAERLASADGLADVAFAAGFADQAHMSREFRDTLGLSPGAYRRLLECGQVGSVQDAGGRKGHRSV